MLTEATVTDTEIRNLQRKAAQRGDWQLFATCTVAVDGVVAGGRIPARQHCADAITQERLVMEREARDSETGDVRNGIMAEGGE